MDPSLKAQAARAAAQGQQQLADYSNKATGYKTAGADFSNQANAANQKIAEQTAYMQGEGSAANQYRGEFEKQKTELGYDPLQMTAARANLNQANGALSAYSDFANTGASKWGLNAGGFAAANAGALGSINNNIAANNSVVSTLSDLYKTAQTGANQFTGDVIQGQHETLAGLQSVYANAANQRDSAYEMMKAYDQLAQNQGGLNAQQQQYYAQAQQNLAAANQAMAQASLLAQQTAAAKLTNQQTTNYMNTQQYKDYLAGKVDANGKKIVSTPTPNGAGTGSYGTLNLNSDGSIPGLSRTPALTLSNKSSNGGW